MMEVAGRRGDLDRGKSLAILLVVFGHLVARDDPAGSGWGAAWYEPLRAAVYDFHIPFLFYLSGYVARWSGATQVSARAYRLLVVRRAQRLLLPALIFGIVILAGKCLLRGALHVDHAPATFASGLYGLFWQTEQSPAQSVWYLIVLFVYAAGIPPLLAICGGRSLRLLLAALPLSFIAAPPVLYADRIFLYAPFFLAGVVAADHDVVWCRWLDLWRKPLLLGFAILVVIAVGCRADVPRTATMIAVSLLALPALHAAVRQLPPYALNLLDQMTPYAFAIYLLNTIFIGLTKAIMMMQLSWTAGWFPVFAGAMMAAGIAGPIMTKILLFRPLPALDHMTR